MLDYGHSCTALKKVSDLQMTAITANTFQRLRCMLIHICGNPCFWGKAGGSWKLDSRRCSAGTSSVSHGGKALILLFKVFLCVHAVSSAGSTVSTMVQIGELLPRGQ